VLHEERAAGESKYSMYRLIRLNFDLVTGFSLMPLQLFSVAGMIVALTSVILYAVVIVQRAIVGGFLEGVKALWDRDILAFFLIGCIMFGVGLLGEYVGRIYQQVRDRPRYVIRAVLERDMDDTGAPAVAAENIRALR
jgi:undecaprenyl-phosphate 4-deoxy-4-formamido-L-arabinose transferase